MCTLCNVERVRMCEASVLNNNDGNNDDDKADLRTEDRKLPLEQWKENSKCNSSTS